MTAAPAAMPDIGPDFVAGLAERAQEAEGLRRLPGATSSTTRCNGSNATSMSCPAT
jgi:hypothetical protein